MRFQNLKENNHPQIWILERKIVDYLMINAIIRIGREILCLPCAGFFGMIIPNGKNFSEMVQLFKLSVTSLTLSEVSLLTLQVLIVTEILQSVLFLHSILLLF